jgi:mRNA-degrading endonuclease RelE of RelBE toxin-antitoxin system
VEFIETSVFTKIITEALTDDEFRSLQSTLSLNPASGSIIRGSGGIRKVRWSRGKRGKSGGLRIIYYWITNDDQILLLLAYSKSEKDDLTISQIEQLRKLVKTELE